MHHDDLRSREIAAEQDFVDRVYIQLETSTRNAQALAREGHGRAHLGHEGGLVERDAMVFQAAKRIAALDAAHEGLVFGRLDLKDPTEGPRHIGRIGLRDQNHDSLLIDWRAPAAAVFYQATPADPQGVVRRRVLRCAGRTVVGVEDDLLDPEVGAELPVIGEGALMAQLSRARDRAMHSIVATIQAEQDRAIRAPGKGVTEITGGPGTGKTVVALHRAAYLLYTDRARYERGGVLVVGPSGVFMRYIERVLPSLGETAVALRSLGEVVDGIRAERRDAPEVAVVKGGARMAELLRRTARHAVPGAPREFRTFYRDDVLVLSPRDLGRLRRTLLAQGRRNTQVAKVASTLVDALWRQVRGERALDRGRDDFVATMLGEDRFLLFVRDWWPSLEATEVLGWLREPELLGRVAGGLLDAQDLAVLSRPDAWGEHLSVEDVPLVDELRYQLGDPPERAEDDEPDPLAHLVDANMPELTTVTDREFASGARTASRTEDDSFAHVLVDEAQDLTPMQWRMVGRRGPSATWTVVGDLGQSSWPHPEEAARAKEVALFGEPADRSVRTRPRHSFRLSTNYRNSAEIYRFAAAYAARAGLPVDLPDAVRRAGPGPRPPSGLPPNTPTRAHISRAAAASAARAGLTVDLPDAVRRTGIDPVEVTTEDLADGVREVVGDLLGAVAGTVGVVSPRARRAEVGRWLAEASEEADAAATQGRLAVLTGVETKGLEFDAIAVVEPEEIERESATGRAALYVVLTRATQRLVTITAG